MRAIYAGIFTPFTNSDLEIVREAARLFDFLMISIMPAVGWPDAAFQEDLRKAVEDCLNREGITNTQVIFHNGYITDLASKYNLDYIVRMHTSKCSPNEELLASYIHDGNPDLKILYLGQPEVYRDPHILMILFSEGKDVSSYIPKEVLQVLEKEKAANEKWKKQIESIYYNGYGPSPFRLFQSAAGTMYMDHWSFDRGYISGHYSGVKFNE